MLRNKQKLTKERIWEIDALRGILILLVLAGHLFCTVTAFCIDGYYNIDPYEWVNKTDPLHFWYDWGADGIIYKAFLTDTLYAVWREGLVNTLFILSGISCMFSRDNFKRALKTLAAGLFIALFTKGLAIWTGDDTRFIRFGVLMCYAFCLLIYICFLENRSNKTLLFVSAPVLAVGYYIRYHGVAAMRLPIFYIFGIPQVGDVSSDYWPILPMLGWFLLGVVIGRKYYSEKRTLLPSRTAQRITRPLQFLGRRSGVIYVGHILIYTVVFCGIGFLLGIL